MKRIAKNQDRSKQIHQESKGQYTNWFQPHLCPPIIVAIQKYNANSNVMHYLQIVYQSPKIPSPYKKLAKIICGFGLHQKRKTQTKLLISNTTRYDC
jgi:hypothetical protein